MSFVDKAKNTVQQAVGKAEEAVGKRTDDQEQIAQGQKDQHMGAARQETEKTKDALDEK
ncbi:CsbD family protein [Kineococcus sp. LSe6-4]|uniref:CsbD family protein n=1 Tax=Kineococcus halophytocola TaxID=3234027 RepID=A0ABV4H6E7_9ACTN